MKKIEDSIGSMSEQEKFNDRRNYTYLSKDLEEAHYVHTIKDVVELMIVYGFDKVMNDILDKTQRKNV